MASTTFGSECTWSHCASTHRNSHRSILSNWTYVYYINIKRDIAINFHEIASRLTLIVKKPEEKLTNTLAIQYNEYKSMLELFLARVLKSDFLTDLWNINSCQTFYNMRNLLHDIQNFSSNLGSSYWSLTTGNHGDLLTVSQWGWNLSSNL